MTSPIYTNTVHYAVKDLITTLTEASAYLNGGDYLAALGTLVLFEDQADDVKAAIRLYRRELQQRGFK